MLILPIKSKWFNMILSGDKQEEYREIKPYYTTRFKKIFEMYPNSNIPTGLDKQLIGFRNGYGSSRPQYVRWILRQVRKNGEQNPEQNTTRYTYTKSEKGKIVKCSRQYLRHIALMS